MSEVADTFCQSSVLIETPVYFIWLDYFRKFFINWSQINVKLLLMIRLQQHQQQQWPFQEAWLKSNKELRPIVSYSSILLSNPCQSCVNLFHTDCFVQWCNTH